MLCSSSGDHPAPLASVLGLKMAIGAGSGHGGQVKVGGKAGPGTRRS